MLVARTWACFVGVKNNFSRNDAKSRDSRSIRKSSFPRWSIVIITSSVWNDDSVSVTVWGLLVQIESTSMRGLFVLHFIAWKNSHFLPKSLKKWRFILYLSTFCFIWVTIYRKVWRRQKSERNYWIPKNGDRENRICQVDLSELTREMTGCLTGARCAYDETEACNLLNGFRKSGNTTLSTLGCLHCSCSNRHTTTTPWRHTLFRIFTEPMEQYSFHRSAKK